MRFKSMYISIITRALVIALGGALAAVGLLKHNYWLVFFGSVLILLLVINLISYYNSINRKLIYFFDAIRNEDNTLSFSENVNTKSTKQLHQSLNRVNNLIKDWKKRNENNERFYLELIEHSSSGLIAFDNEGYTAIVNSMAKSFLGLHNKSNIILLKQRNPEIYNVFTTMLPGQSTTLRLIQHDEPVFLTISLTSIKFGENTYRIFSLKNIKQELDEKEFDSWQKLIRVLTHEIMNSIAPITSLSNTLSGFFKLQGKRVEPNQITQDTISNTLEGLEVIEERGKGLIKFVDSYRAMTRFPEPKFTSIDIAAFFGKLVQLTKALDCGQNIQFKTSIKGVNHILADEELLMQAMINIVKNACEAMCNHSDNYIEIMASVNAENNPVISIKDNGKGIPHEIQERMFVPFFTTKENGSGIGLSVCRQIMRLQNGSVGIKSTPGKGTVVSLIFR